MGGKKKKKGGKKKKKEEKKDGEEGEKEEENPLFTVNLPVYGWIRLELKLCDPPVAKTQVINYNTFRTVMRSNQSIVDVKKRIIDYHGRIENINMYNQDPYPVRKNEFKKEKKPRVPPFSEIDRLQKMKQEKELIEEKEARDIKKLNAGEKLDEDPNAYKYDQEEEDPHRFDELLNYDFPEDARGEMVVQYQSDKTTLYQIFEEYGTVARPTEEPEPISTQPIIKKPKPAPKPKPTPVVPKEEGEEGKEGEDPASPTKIPDADEEEEEEKIIPPVERTLWYDFDAFDGKDPVLLALMHRGEGDLFTL